MEVCKQNIRKFLNGGDIHILIIFHSSHTPCVVVEKKRYYI